jgi:hypothetical protein
MSRLGLPPSNKPRKGSKIMSAAYKTKRTARNFVGNFVRRLKVRYDRGIIKACPVVILPTHGRVQSSQQCRSCLHERAIAVNLLEVVGSLRL